MQDIFLRLLNELVQMIIDLLPSLILSIIILVVGYLVGRITGKAVEGAVKLIKGDESFRSSELGRRLTESGYPISRILSILARGTIYVLTITAAISVLNIPALQEFSTTIANYLPKLVGAVVIFLFGAMLIEWLAGFTEGLLRGGVLPEKLVGMFTTGIKYIFYIVLAFMMFEIADIAPQVVSSVALAIFSMIGIGAGLAFALLVGLGLREEAPIILFDEPKELKPGITIEVNGLVGKIRKISTLLIELETEDGLQVIPKRLLIKNGYKIIKNSLHDKHAKE